MIYFSPPIIVRYHYGEMSIREGVYVAIQLHPIMVPKDIVGAAPNSALLEETKEKCEKRAHF